MGASLMALMLKNLPAMQETQVWFLGWEDPLEKGMTTHSSILTWRIPWTKETGYSPRDCKKSDTTEWLTHIHSWISRLSVFGYWWCVSSCLRCLPAGCREQRWKSCALGSSERLALSAALDLAYCHLSDFFSRFLPFAQWAGPPGSFLSCLSQPLHLGLPSAWKALLPVVWWTPASPQ